MSDDIIIARIQKTGRRIVRVLDNGQEAAFVQSSVGSSTDDQNEVSAQADPDNLPLSDERLGQMKPVPRVRTLRRALGQTQEEFSAKYSIPLGTLRDWEQGRSEPDAATKAYLKVIAREPDAVQRALTATSELRSQFVEVFRGILSNFSPLVLVTEEALSEADKPLPYEGVEVPLSKLFAKTDRRVEWQSVNLRIICAYSADGLIRLLKASVSRDRPSGFGDEIALEFTDSNGVKKGLALSPRQSSAVIKDSELMGPIGEIEMTVLVRQELR